MNQLYLELYRVQVRPDPLAAARGGQLDGEAGPEEVDQRARAGAQRGEGGGGEGGAGEDEPLGARPGPRHAAVQARVPGSAVVSAAHKVSGAVRVGVTITCPGEASSNITYRSDAHLVQDRTELWRCNMTTR